MEMVVIIALILVMCSVFIFCEYWNDRVQKYQHEQHELEDKEYREWQRAFSSDLNATLQRQRECELERIRIQKEAEFQKELLKMDYMSMDHYKFESFVAEVLNQFGYDVTTTQQTADMGKDLQGFAPSGRTLYGEVKHYKEDNVIGRPMLQKLIGAGQIANIQEFVFVTTSSYTKEAIEYAKECSRNNIPFRLIDAEEFYQMVEQLHNQIEATNSIELEKAPNV